ncbi:MAG: HlyC/CorC family transporter [Clostridiales bacterium]|nr:HlyC/CorC family transporter [Clostridiales bacterium]
MSWFIIVLLILTASYFATAETAFATASRIKIKSEADRGDRRAKKALYVLDNFDRAITTILIGTNIVHIVTAALVTILVTKRWGISAVTISTIITTLVIFFLGEMLPKSIGKKYSCRFSLSIAPSMCLFMRIFAPLAYFLTLIGQAVAKRTKGDSEVTVTEDELYDIIENMKDEGELDAERGELVHSALMFADVTAESVVTSRVDVAAIDIKMPLQDILAFVKASKHSRFPVYEGNIDNIIGVLQIRRFIKSYIKQGDALDIKSVLDDTHFAHQSTKIDELLSEMSRKRVNMAVVTDNYGGTLGIVTVEDILEELVGDIWDEDDDVKEFCVLLSDGSYELDTELSIEESFELMGYEDPEDFDFEHKLLGEWVYEHFDRIPSKGDSFEYNGLHITVHEMNNNRIVKLHAKLLPEANEEGGRRK